MVSSKNVRRRFLISLLVPEINFWNFFKNKTIYRKWRTLFDQTPIWSKISSYRSILLNIFKSIYRSINIQLCENWKCCCWVFWFFWKLFWILWFCLLLMRYQNWFGGFFSRFHTNFHFGQNFLSQFFGWGFSILKNFVASCNFCLSQNIDLLDL